MRTWSDGGEEIRAADERKGRGVRRWGREESHISDRIQPIGDGSKVVGGAVDAVEVAADGLKMKELGGGASELVKRKRGRPAKAQAKPPAVKPAVTKPPLGKKIKEEDEDVCFICFDGGSLVLCDHQYVSIPRLI
ncbi:hypothetical protein SSX86_025152 [Deinandra increscens subsp. villosa]|uniref:Uncharacterized protein n=1 Tax=Deinandra increscens subsp. villosa TaxID=3103831 RepID=A0AAP0GLS4_9ASTR